MDTTTLLLNGLNIISHIPIEKLFLRGSDNSIERLEARLKAKGLLDDEPSKAPPTILNLPVATPEMLEVYDNGEDSAATPGPSEYSGTSQISAQGKACIPCGSDHFSTVSGELSEAMRFARREGIEHPEVLVRIAHAEDELNVFEREDGSPDKVVALPPHEKKLMNKMLNRSRELRHALKEIKDVDSLEQVAAQAIDTRMAIKRDVFQMMLGKLPLAQREEIKKRAMAIVNGDGGHEDSN